MADLNDFFSRERLAGYDPDRLARASVLLVGAGALGSNVAQTLALSGLGEVWIVDPDVLEPSNATRSPLVPRASALGPKRRSKAREIAHAVLRASYANHPAVRYADKKIEALGLGIFRKASVVAAAVDSFRVRAWIADACRLAGVPLVEGGFNGSHGQVSVYPNDSPDAPCYRCLNPGIESGVSCSLYARSVLAEGRTPATQTIAALTGAYAAEAAIRLLHPASSPLQNRMVTFDVATGRSSLVALTRDPDCEGVHRKAEEVRGIPVGVAEPVTRIFEFLDDLVEPEIVLRAEYLVQAPCVGCGTRVHIGKPEWALTRAPHCGRCAEAEGGPVAPVVTVSRVRPGDALAKRPCKKLGLAPFDMVEVSDRATGKSLWVGLSGWMTELLAFKCGALPNVAVFDFEPVSPGDPQAVPESEPVDPDGAT